VSQSITGVPQVSHAERRRRTNELLLAAHATEAPERRAHLLDEVIILNQCVAEAVANRYRGRGVAEEDLHQSAFEGLVKAVHKFDPSVRPDLLTYAVPSIRGEVQRWFRDHGWMVRPPRNLQELQWRINRSVEHLSTSKGRPPSDDELSQDVGCSLAELRETLQSYGCFRPQSLDSPVGNQAGMTLGERLVSTDDSDTAAAEARVMLRSVLPSLPEQERTILYLRFFEDLTQREIGARLGVTQMHVSRVLEKIIRRLRSQLAA
jgi:RNA polymerase sigma-B factor